MKQLKTSILALLIFTVITGVIYPAVVTGIGKVFFREKIEGSLIVRDGSVTGSALIGQNFEEPEFFHGRPSSVNYDSGGSGGSNMGPANEKFLQEIKIRADKIMQEFNLASGSELPPDFVFASASGLDPHISIETARLQAGRIAGARKIDRSEVLDIINSNIEKQFYFYGSSYVNVLKLNSSLIDRGVLK